MSERTDGFKRIAHDFKIRKILPFGEEKTLKSPRLHAIYLLHWYDLFTK